MDEDEVCRGVRLYLIFVLTAPFSTHKVSGCSAFAAGNFMENVNLTILGSSSGMPQSSRANSGYVIIYQGIMIQVDCGGGVSSAFRKAGFDPLKVDSVLISHAHPDHISDLPLYIQMQYLAGRKEPLPIYLPEELVEPIPAYFRSVYLPLERMPFKLEFLPVPEGGVITMGDATVRPIPNNHLRKYQPIIEEFKLKSKMQCYSYLFEIAGKKILYSADLGSENDILAFLKGLDLLVIESTHIDVGKVLDAAIASNVRQVVLTHIAEEYDTESAVMSARKLGYDNLSIAYDGMRIELL
jgi:ribonuclease Z